MTRPPQTRYATAHEAQARATLTGYTKIPKPIIEQMALPRWSTAIDLHSLELFSALSNKYGILKSQPSVKELTSEGPERK